MQRQASFILHCIIAVRPCVMNSPPKALQIAILTVFTPNYFEIVISSQL